VGQHEEMRCDDTIFVSSSLKIRKKKDLIKTKMRQNVIRYPTPIQLAAEADTFATNKHATIAVC